MKNKKAETRKRANDQSIKSNNKKKKEGEKQDKKGKDEDESLTGPRHSLTHSTIPAHHQLGIVISSALLLRHSPITIQQRWMTWPSPLHSSSSPSFPTGKCELERKSRREWHCSTSSPQQERQLHRKDLETDRHKKGGREIENGRQESKSKGKKESDEDKSRREWHCSASSPQQERQHHKKALYRKERKAEKNRKDGREPEERRREETISKTAESPSSSSSSSSSPSA